MEWAPTGAASANFSSLGGIKLRTEALMSLRLTEEQREELTLPPPGEPFEVSYRMTCFHLGEVDTLRQTASVKMGIVLYWTDPRMVGWSSPILPPTLWGPEMVLRNAIGSVQTEYEQFVVADSGEGRMKRIINYDAIVVMTMDLHRFPFDMQAIAPEWVSISHWRQLDGTRYGSRPKGVTYKLQQVQRPDEGVPMLMFFGGSVAEWRLEACAMNLTTAVNPAGFTLTKLQCKFVASRMYQYYLTKVVVPLACLVVATHLVFFIEPHLLADRLGHVFTMFLAAVGLLYVASEHVPNVRDLEPLTGGQPLPCSKALTPMTLVFGSSPSSQ